MKTKTELMNNLSTYVDMYTVHTTRWLWHLNCFQIMSKQSTAGDPKGNENHYGGSW